MCDKFNIDTNEENTYRNELHGLFQMLGDVCPANAVNLRVDESRVDLWVHAL